MAIYFLLGQLTTEGQRMHADAPPSPEKTTKGLDTEQARILGQYPVLGHYDLIAMVEADSNAAVAQLSAAFGSRTGMRFETLIGVNPTVAVPVPSIATPHVLEPTDAD